MEELLNLLGVWFLILGSIGLVGSFFWICDPGKSFLVKLILPTIILIFLIIGSLGLSFLQYKYNEIQKTEKIIYE